MNGWYLADLLCLPASLEGATPGVQDLIRLDVLALTPRSDVGLSQFDDFAVGKLDNITVLDPP